MTQTSIATPSTLAGVIRAIQEIKAILMGRVTFKDNIAAEIITDTNSVAVGLDLEIGHRLGRIPSGFIAYGIDMAPIIYKSSTPWTSTKIYVKSTLSPVTFQIIIF